MKKILHILILSCLALPAYVSAQYSDASVNGPWMARTSTNANYIIFDGAGNIVELGTSDDTLHPMGTYSITSSGVITGTMNFVFGTQYIYGQMTSTTSADLLDTTGVNSPGSIHTSAVTDPGALAGTWAGLIFDQGSNTSRSVQLTVNTSGVITAATGFPLVSGKIFEANDTFAAYIVTTDDSCNYKAMELYGIYNGTDSLVGDADLGSHIGSCETHGYVSLVRTSTGIANMNNELSFTVYPNPFFDQVNIKIEGANSRMTADIYDLCGRRVFVQALGDASNSNLELSTLGSGMYMLTLTDEFGHSATKKIIKN